MKVNIPFQPQHEWPMILDRKTITSRTKWFGKAGDWFEAFSTRFVITYLFKYTLEGVANDFYKQEGVKSPEAFKDVWCSLHPGRGWQPKQVVFCHQFRRLEPNEQIPGELL